MSKLRSILVTCAVCLPLAAFGGDARKSHNALKGHPNLIKAERELINAAASITKSQEANECVFGLEGGHGQKAKELIEKAYDQVYEAAEYINAHGGDCAKVVAPKEKLKKAEAPKAHGALKGHKNLLKAEKDLVASWNAISRSQEGNECVFGLEGGHGEKAKAAIDAAYRQVYDAAEYVNTHPNDCVKKK
jgi:hypothetical protein